MRYRPFGRSGMAVSAFSLLLSGEDDHRRASEWVALVHAALEHGVNAFELARPSEALLAGFAEGIAAVRRTLLFVALRAHPDFTGRRLDGWVAEAAGAAGVGEFNLLTLPADTPEFEEVLGAGLRLQDLGLVRRMAVLGHGEVLQDHVEDPLFDAIAMPFGLTSGWRDRHIVRTGLERQMGVIAYDPCPPQLAAVAKEDHDEARGGWFKRSDPLRGVGSHAFLMSTPGWTAEQICLAYALTEPAVTTVQMPVTDVAELEVLAEVPDRNLPSQITAQIEMAHFAQERTDRTRVGDKRRA
jgi:aryl-alcohol dehydrogenase-like predicted oxidoreductase